MSLQLSTSRPTLTSTVTGPTGYYAITATLAASLDVHQAKLNSWQHAAIRSRKASTHLLRITERLLSHLDPD